MTGMALSQGSAVKRAIVDIFLYVMLHVEVAQEYS
jgi:hypothetical protein